MHVSGKVLDLLTLRSGSKDQMKNEINNQGFTMDLNAALPVCMYNSLSDVKVRNTKKEISENRGHVYHK